MTLLDVERPEQATTAFRSLAGKGRVDGLLVVSLPPTPAQLERLRVAGIPVVLVDRCAEGAPASTHRRRRRRPPRHRAPARARP